MRFFYNHDCSNILPAHSGNKKCQQRSSKDVHLNGVANKMKSVQQQPQFCYAEHTLQLKFIRGRLDKPVGTCL